MPRIQDHAFMKLCAELATLRSISLASARRHIEILATKEGLKNIEEKKTLAAKLIKDSRSLSESSNKDTPGNQLDNLLEALAEEENFMLED